jgi:hypothetical protein
MPEQNQLTTGMKNVINPICEGIINFWPPFTGGEAAESKNILSLVNAYAFVTAVFNPKLQLEVNRCLNKADKYVNKNDKEKVRKRRLVSFPPPLIITQNEAVLGLQTRLQVRIRIIV